MVLTGVSGPTATTLVVMTSLACMGLLWEQLVVTGRETVPEKLRRWPAMSKRKSFSPESFPPRVELVEGRGFEPPTSALRRQRSPN
jgi:hypothetical protein